MVTTMKNREKLHWQALGDLMLTIASADLKNARLK